MKPVVVFFAAAFLILVGALMVLSEDSKATYVAYYNSTNETVGDSNFRWNNSDQTLRINGSVLVGGIPVCLMDGSNCPNISGNASQGPAGTNGTNGINGTNGLNGTNGINGTNGLNGSFVNGSDVWVGSINFTNAYTNFEGDGVNNSLSISEAAIAITDTDGLETYAYSTGFWTSGQVRGASLDIDQLLQASAGVVEAHDLAISPLGGSGGILRIKDDFGNDVMNISGYSGGLYLNGTANITGQVYSNGVLVCQQDGTNCPPSGSGNSSFNESYTNTLYYPLNSNPRGYYNSSTIPTYVLLSSLSGAVGQNLTYALINANMGNWSQDKASYATNVHVANVNGTALKNGTVASLAGLTVTSDATVEGVLVVDPGTATAAAVRVGGPLTTYSALQFQSEQNKTRDFVFSSVNNSVASNRMAFRVSGNEAGSNSGGDLSVLRFDDAGGFIDTVMKIDRSDGFVGIGDSTPDAKLDVFGSTILDGEVNSTGHIRADGNSIPLMTAWVNKTIANQTVTGTTLANIDNLGWLAEANKNYTFDCSIYYRSNTTTNGISFAIEDTGGTVTRIKMGATIQTVSTTTVNSGVALAVGTKVTSTAVQAVNTPYQAFLTGTVINGGSAVTINPQFSAEVASLNSTIVQDSWCEVRIV